MTRLDRNRHGGGIVLYIKDSLPFKVILLGPENLELIFVTIFPATVNQICLGFFIRPPSSSLSNVLLLIIHDSIAIKNKSLLAVTL